MWYLRYNVTFNINMIGYFYIKKGNETLLKRKKKKKKKKKKGKYFIPCSLYERK